MPKVLITDSINPAAVEILEEVATVTYEPKLSQEELEARIAEFDGLMIRSASTVTEATFSKAPRLQIVGRAGVGVDNINIPAANRHGCVVVNSPEGNTVAASEHTVGLLLALSRNIPDGDTSLKAGNWDRKRLTGVELFNKTLGLIGLGKIGSRVAKAARALGMKLYVYDPYVSADAIEQLNATKATLEDIWAKSDYITVHVPKTPETTHLINAEVLGKCKKGVRLVNCARGGIIDEAALVAAIESGQVAGAALDVFEKEPLPADSPLLKLGNKLITTPHLGASTEEAQVNVALDVAEQLRDFFKTGTARSAVNSPLLRSSVMDPVRPYLSLCEVLGSFVRQLGDGAAKSVEIHARGTAAEASHIEPLNLAVMKGLLSTTREGVNYVNALFLAEERGIEVKSSKSKTAGAYSNLITVTLHTESGEYKVAGTLLGLNNFRIVQVQHFHANLEPSPFILVAPHEDKPGMVGQLSQLLAKESINISALAVGRDSHAQESIMLFNLDSDPSKELVSQMKEIAGVKSARLVRLPSNK